MKFLNQIHENIDTTLCSKFGAQELRRELIEICLTKLQAAHKEYQEFPKDSTDLFTLHRIKYRIDRCIRLLRQYVTQEQVSSITTNRPIKLIFYNSISTEDVLGTTQFFIGDKILILHPEPNEDNFISAPEILGPKIIELISVSSVTLADVRRMIWEKIIESKEFRELQKNLPEDCLILTVLGSDDYRLFDAKESSNFLIKLWINYNFLVDKSLEYRYILQ